MLNSVQIDGSIYVYECIQSLLELPRVVLVTSVLYPCVDYQLALFSRCLSLNLHPLCLFSRVSIWPQIVFRMIPISRVRVVAYRRYLLWIIRGVVLLTRFVFWFGRFLTWSFCRSLNICFGIMSITIQRFFMKLLHINRYGAWDMYHHSTVHPLILGNSVNGSNMVLVAVKLF